MYLNINKCEEGESMAAEEMTVKEYYSEIVELSAQLIEKHCYKRSGKSGIFYKYNSDKSKGYLIGFRRSLYNTSDFCKFHILFGSVGVDELRDFGIYHSKISLQDLKSRLMNGYSALGHSHRLDDYVIKNENVNDYFQLNILPELEKILDQLSTCRQKHK